MFQQRDNDSDDVGNNEYEDDDDIDFAIVVTDGIICGMMVTLCRP
jgi:hypothetical protein